MNFTENADFLIEFDDTNQEKNMSPIITLLTEEYKGVRYRYHSTSMEKLDQETMRIHFDYEIIDAPEQLPDLTEDAEFKQHIGLLLNHFLISYINQKADSYQTVEMTNDT